MSNWKDKINTRIKREKEKEEEASKKHDAKMRREEQERLDKFRKKFKCHVCDKPSSGPAVSKGYREFGTIFPGGSKIWDTPKDRSKCKKCVSWACEDHLYRDYCEKCANRM